MKIYHGEVLSIAVTRTSHTKLNKHGENGPCLVPDLRGKVFKFSPLSMMLAMGLSYMAFIMLRYVPSIPILLRIFITKGCRILWNVSSASIEMIICFLSFILLMCCITSIDLQMLNHPCIPWVNPSWLWCVTPLMYCWIQFTNSLLRIFASMFIKDSGL